MQPRPPLLQRLRPGQQWAVSAVVGVGYAALAWAVFSHKVVPWPLAVVGTMLAAGPLAICHRRPMAAFAAALLAFWLAAADPVWGFLALPPLAYVVYQIAARYRARTALVVFGLSLTGPLATAMPHFAATGAIAPFTAVLIMAAAIGYGRGEHRRYGEELLRHHAGRVEVERERARRGVTEERMRIARELHDVMAHGISVITVQAGYGHLILDTRPAEARAALAVIETTGRQTMTEMRRLLDVLRQDDEDADLAPSPGLAHLAHLIDQIGHAGVHVELSVAGDPRDLPAGIDLSAHRILQEALTNVVRHAGTSTARATIAYQAGELVIDVSDNGRGGPIGTAGHGLTGMRERAQLYGGCLDAGPLPDQGFRVLARLPLPQPAEYAA